MKAVGRSGRLRAYASGLVTSALVLAFALAEWWTNKYIADRSRFAGTAIELAIVVVAALAFRPIHHRVESAVEAALTKRRREARAALARLRKELTSFNDAQQVLRRVVEAVDHHMNAAGCAIYLRRDDYRAEISSFDSAAERIPVDDALAVRLRSTAAPANPSTLHSKAAGAIAFPMMAGGELVGFLSVTPKGYEFEPDDRQAIAALAEAVGLALVALDPRLRARDVDAPTNNLPLSLPLLIGRDEELAEIKALLEQSRLVTVIGAGGIGKTRAALQVAAEMPYADGVWFVDLAPLDDPAHVPSAIAEVFNVADEGGARRLIDRVAGVLKARQLLIVLDNCEHLISAAAEAAGHLLQVCPGIRVLATSREPLGIDGEEPYRMPTLPVPPENENLTAERVLQYGAAALFVARAHSAQRSFALTDENAPLVADIVRRLDGIALAIELAAPRIKVLSLPQLSQRLDERFRLLSGGSRTAQPRHQTLHALIGWSYDLLSEAEQSLLRRCAIFRGGWTLEAAEAVCAGERAAEWNELDLLSALVDKSLVVVEAEGDDRRYRLLESTRQFGAERLDELGEREDVAARHGRYFAGVALESGDAYWQTDSDRWTAQVRRELENHRAAIGWGLAGGGDATAAATIVASLRWLWYAARREGHALLERATARAADAPARVHGLLALAAAVLDNSAQAAVPAAEAARALSGVDEVGRAEALAFHGTALGRGGRITESITLFDEALTAARATHTPRLIGWVLTMAAYWNGAAGDRAGARALFDEASMILRACSDPWQFARLQLHRAEFLFAEDDLVGALESVSEAEAIFRERNADSGLCVTVLNATAYVLALARLDDGWTFAREGLELSLRLDDAMSAAWAIGHLGQIAAETGEVVQAARLLGYADAAYRKTGSAREPTERRGYDRALELIRVTLSDDRIHALMAEGAALDQSSAIAEALKIPQPAVSDVGRRAGWTNLAQHDVLRG
jgi:predicted ATPase